MFCCVKQIHPFLVQIVLLPSFVPVLKSSPKQSLPSKLEHLADSQKLVCFSWTCVSHLHMISAFRHKGIFTPHIANELLV